MVRHTMYTIGQAAARTGLGAPLIRAWERRYGVVAPTRTPGGYRLYDDDAIRVLLAMRGLVAQGWTASEAARAKLTVFAPTDAAFEALFDTLGVAGVDDIPVPLLRAVLLHHVAPGERSSGDVLGATRIRMLDKSFTHPSFASGIATIDGAAIVIPDVDVSNGVIPSSTRCCSRSQPALGLRRDGGASTPPRRYVRAARARLSR